MDAVYRMAEIIGRTRALSREDEEGSRAIFGQAREVITSQLGDNSAHLQELDSIALRPEGEWKNMGFPQEMLDKIWRNGHSRLLAALEAAQSDLRDKAWTQPYALGPRAGRSAPTVQERLACPAHSAVEIDGLMDRAGRLEFGDYDGLYEVKLRAALAVREALGEDTRLLADLDEIRFHPRLVVGKPSQEFLAGRWESGQKRLMSFLGALRDLLERPSERQDAERAADPQRDTGRETGNRVFVVYGRDQGMRESVARLLEKLGLEAVLLPEPPDIGFTIVEKIEANSAVGFAVVCLSGDDMGCERLDFPASARRRARQNVVFEFGYFMGLLTRGKVVVLYREEDEVEFPSDVHGRLYKVFDKAGAWKVELAKELRAAGYEIDLNRLA